MNRLDIALWILAHPFLFGFLIFASVMLAFGMGRMFGSTAVEPAAGNPFGLMDGAVFALLGLLFAFTFSSAAARFDNRRALIVEEANAISTARLRVDLVPTDARQPLRAAFDSYIASRLANYEKATDPKGFAEAFARTEAIQKDIWNMAVEAGRRPDALPAVNQQLIPALNAMFDITTTRGMALATHTPAAVMISLWLATMFATAIAGFSSRSSTDVRWMSVAGYAVMISLSINLIIDFEYPRAGLIRVDDFDAVLKSQLSGNPSVQ